MSAEGVHVCLQQDKTTRTHDAPPDAARERCISMWGMHGQSRFILEHHSRRLETLCPQKLRNHQQKLLWSGEQPSYSPSSTCPWSSIHHRFLIIIDSIIDSSSMLYRVFIIIRVFIDSSSSLH
jgi:hypothetical protein